jgi:nitroreductase
MTQPDPQAIRDAVELACHARSLHNSQPWHWVARGSEKGTVLELFAVRDPLVRSTDSSGRNCC